MKINLVLFLFLSLTTGLCAQDTSRVVDRVFTADNKVYVGQITDDKKGDSLTIEVYQKGAYVIGYKLITKIQYRVDNPNYTEPPSEASPSPRAMRAAQRDTTDLGLIAFNGYRATPRVTDKLVKKRNIGIGLTIGGACLIGLGAVVYAVTPKQSILNSSSGQAVGPSAGSIGGILMIVAGIGIAIPGAAIWGSYAHRLHKAEMDN